MEGVFGENGTSGSYCVLHFCRVLKRVHS